MDKDKRAARLGKVAWIRTKKLNALISTLQNTTIGTINSDIEAIELNINNLYNTSIVTNNKIASIADIFGITFNPDGTAISQTYTQHTHEYTDSTILDTADGTGTVQSEDKETGAVTQ